MTSDIMPKNCSQQTAAMPHRPKLDKQRRAAKTNMNRSAAFETPLNAGLNDLPAR
jgi:hypothetical protein